MYASQGALNDGDDIEILFTVNGITISGSYKVFNVIETETGQGASFSDIINGTLTVQYEFSVTPLDQVSMLNTVDSDWDLIDGASINVL